MTCAKCGEIMDMTEKDTSSGRDIREYKCSRCGHSDWEDRGTALWKILHDDREKSEAAKAAEADPLLPISPETRAASGISKQSPPSSRWGRFLARIARFRKS
jgi:DNA-directed RNA polymerase subunit M/transcription elongation factor TFIIS